MVAPAQVCCRDNKEHTMWRQRAGAPFQTDKLPASGSRGMVVTNHPLASAAGAQMLAAGGNAVDAAVASLFTLSVSYLLAKGGAGVEQ